MHKVCKLHIWIIFGRQFEISTNLLIPRKRERIEQSLFMSTWISSSALAILTFLSLSIKLNLQTTSRIKMRTTCSKIWKGGDGLPYWTKHKTMYFCKTCWLQIFYQNWFVNWCKIYLIRCWLLNLRFKSCFKIWLT